MVHRVLKFFQKMISYVWPVPLKQGRSAHSGPLSIRVEEGVKVLNTTNCNFSYGSLQEVFRLTLDAKPLPENCTEILILGYGAGSIAEVLRQEKNFTGKITGVDFDDKLLSFAQKHFPDAFKNVDLHISAADEFLEENESVYDSIFVDLFVDDETHPSSFRPEFIASLAGHCEEGGRVYHNLILRRKELLQDLVAIYSRHFKTVSSLRLLGSNYVIVAGR